MTAVGSLAQIWRYPLRSGRGESIERAWVGPDGVLGDRGYSVVDRESHKEGMAAGKKKWRRLLTLSAHYPQDPEPDAPLPPVHLTFPGGAVCSADDAAMDAQLSAVIGEPVFLWRDGAKTPSVQRHYLADPLHLITTGTLNRLARSYPDGQIDSQRFRANLIIDSGEAADFIEDAWVGRELRFTGGVRIEITEPCGRCVMTTLPQGDLLQDSGILQAISKLNGGNAGVYGKVLQPGFVAAGESLVLA